MSFKVLSLCLFVIFPSIAQAAPSTMPQLKLRKTGISLNFLGEPFPSFVSLSLQRYLFSGLRSWVGYGIVNSSNPQIISYGGGFKTFIRDWRIQPVLGIGWAQTASSYKGKINNRARNFLVNAQSIGTNDCHWYSTFAFEYTTKKARSRFSVGIQQSLRYENYVLPYIQWGIYF